MIILELSTKELVHLQGLIFLAISGKRPTKAEKHAGREIHSRLHDLHLEQIMKGIRND